MIAMISSCKSLPCAPEVAHGAVRALLCGRCFPCPAQHVETQSFGWLTTTEGGLILCLVHTAASTVSQLTCPVYDFDEACVEVTIAGSSPRAGRPAHLVACDDARRRRVADGRLPQPRRQVGLVHLTYMMATELVMERSSKCGALEHQAHLP